MVSRRDSASRSLPAQDRPYDAEEVLQPPFTSTRNNLVLGILGTAFIGTVGLISPFIYMQLRSPLPYMATPRRKIEAAIRVIAERRNSTRAVLEDGTAGGKNVTNVATERYRFSESTKQPNGECLRFVDLGSGDGTAVFASASQGWQATGMELNPTLWFLSSLRRLSHPRDVRIRSSFIWGDMFSRSDVLRKADCVMVFGVTPLMPRIAQMVQKECRPGTCIMSYRFRVPLLVAETPESEISDDSKGQEVRGISASLIYDHEEMRIYEKI